MNDQLFVNTYIKLLNDTLTEAVNKNLVLQAQLEVAKHTNAKAAESEAKVGELEAKVKQFSSLSSDNTALQTQINSLKAQLEQAHSQVNNKNSHVETFKRELVDARNVIKNQTTEIESLKTASTQVAVTLNSQAQKTIDTLKVEHQQKVDLLTANIELLEREIEELKSKKRKEGKSSKYTRW